MLCMQYILLSLIGLSVSENMFPQCVTTEANAWIIVASNGSPKTLNRSLRQLLSGLCPWLDAETHGYTCCEENILEMLKSRINEIQGYFELCSPCYQRYVDHLCRMMCGPDQANYLHITSLQPKSFTNPKVVHEVQMTLNTKWVEVIIAECSTLYEGTSSGNLTAWLTNLWDNASAFRPYKLTYKVVAKTVNGLETKLLNQSLCLEQINKQYNYHLHFNVDPSLSYSYPHGTLSFYVYIYAMTLTVFLLVFFITEDPSDMQFRDPKCNKPSFIQIFGENYNRFQRRNIYWWSVASHSPWMTLVLSCCILAYLSSGVFDFTFIEMQDVYNWYTKFSQVNLDHRRPSTLARVHVTYVAMPNATTWRSSWMVNFLEDFIEDILGLTTAENKSFIHMCQLLPIIQQCGMSSYLDYFDNSKTNDMDHVVNCMNDPYQRECISDFGLSNTRYDVAAGFEGNNFKIAILKFYTTLADQVSLRGHLAWEDEFKSYNRLKKQELASNGIRLYFRSSASLRYINIVLKNPGLVRTILLISFTLQLVYMACIFRKGRIVLPLAILSINLASLIAACGTLSLIGYKAPYNLMEILPCFVLAIGSDNMIMLVITENCGIEKPPEVTTISYLRSVLWEVVPSTRCNNLSLVTCSLFAHFSVSANEAALAMYVTLTFGIQFVLEETCFMAVLLLESRGRSSFGNCNPFPPCKLPFVLQPNRNYTDILVNSYYIPLLTSRLFQVLIIVVSLIIICLSLNLCYSIAIGEDMEPYLSMDPEVRDFIEFERENSAIGHNVVFLIIGGLDFSDEYNQKLLSMESPDSIFYYIKAYGKYSKRSFIMADDMHSWIDDFNLWMQTIGCCRVRIMDQRFCMLSDPDHVCYPCQTENDLDWDNSHLSKTELFYRNLHFFLQSVPTELCPYGGHNKHYLQTNIDDLRSSFYIKTYHSPLKTTDDHVNAIKSAQYISDQMTLHMRTHVSKRGHLSPEQVSAIEVKPFSEFYMEYDYTNFTSTTLISFVVTLLLVFLSNLFSSALSLPGSMFVALNTILICAPLTSVMIFWDVSGTTTTLSFIQTFVGVSVRFCTVLVNAFENSTRKRRDDRQVHAVQAASRQILYGIIGTKIFGLIPVAFTQHREFNRLFTGLCVSGCIHAVFVVPTLIYIMGPPVNLAKVYIKVHNHRC